MNRTILVDGTKIGLEDTGGSGPTIVLCHGGSCSRRAFERQLRSELAERFRLVALDLPGHGDSDRSSTPDSTYTLPGYARVVVDVVRALDLERSVFVGWSMGGHVLFHAGIALPKALGFFVFGAAPVGKPPALDRMYVQDPALGVGFRAESTEAEIRALIARFFRPGAEIPELYYDDFRRSDPRTRDALAASIARGDFEDELALLERTPAPFAIAHGANDAIVNGAYFSEIALSGLWRDGVQFLPDVGHSIHWEAARAFNALLSEFASERARATVA